MANGTEDPMRAAKKKVQGPRPRWLLHMQATFWRVLMSLGMLFHKLAPPRPPKPNFSRQIPAKISGKPGVITLYFYVPRDYETQKRLWIDRPKFRDDVHLDEEEEETLMGNKSKRRVSTALSTMSQHIRRRSISGRKWGGYAVMINFHGGGFTLGTATDDARWCGTVVDECNAVVVSVDYRLAPEFPFPTAVEDGVDAVIWIHEHADELGIDREKIAISGFSSGGNMAFTVPLRLYDEQTGFQRDDAETQPETQPSASSSRTQVAPDKAKVELLEPDSPPPTAHPTPAQKQPTAVTKARNVPDVRIRCLIPWYPSLDYTRTRAQRRSTNVRKDQELSAIFTDLFDESYLHPPNTISLDSPYLSPGVAPTELLANALPDDIIMSTCEWDMLLDEGEAFRKRLEAEPLGKNVRYHVVKGVPHGWDKAPNPWKPTPGVRAQYLRVCREVREILAPTHAGGAALRERTTSGGLPSVAPRGSVQVVR